MLRQVLLLAPKSNENIIVQQLFHILELPGRTLELTGPHGASGVSFSASWAPLGTLWSLPLKC